jgi:hypothetical protein
LPCGRNANVCSCNRRRREAKHRKRVIELLATGLSFSEVAVTLGVSKPTVSYHARRLGIAPSSKFSRRYDWSEIQRYYDAGHSITECQLHFGFARKTFWDAVQARRCDDAPTGDADPSVVICPEEPDAPEEASFRSGTKGEPVRMLWTDRVAWRAIVHGASSRQRGWPRQPTRESSAALPELPLAD